MCMYTYTDVYIHRCIHTQMYTYTDVESERRSIEANDGRVCICVCVYVYVCVCMYVYMYALRCVNACMCECVCIHRCGIREKKDRSK